MKIPHTTSISNLQALVFNLLLVFVAYSLCRLVFYAVNLDLYSDVDTFRLMRLMVAGLRFDTSAILYTNALVILLFLLPLKQKENHVFYYAVRWIYTIVNTLCVASNLMDCAYYPYTGRRTTLSIFREFANEGSESMADIIGYQLWQHWYLVVIAAGMCWGFYRLFRYPHAVRNLRHHVVSYYFVNGTLLLLAVPLCVVGMRGGMNVATRPITISNANEYAERADETGIILNTPFSLIRTFNKKAFVTPRYLSEEDALELFNPLHEREWAAAGRNDVAWPDTTGLQPLNVVVLILESFSKQHIGFYNDDNGKDVKSFTPFLDSLIAECGLTYRYSYANGRKSIEAMPSVLSGIPSFVEPLVLTPASLNTISGLARELSRHEGYCSAFFHGAENGSMGFEAFAKSSGFERYYGKREYDRDAHYGGSMDFDGTWAVWDEEFLQFTCDRMSELPAPFMVSVFTATSHSPFVLPQRYDGHFPSGRHPIQRCIAYSDHALRRFFEKASRQPWFTSTLFVLTADHVSGQLDPAYQTSLGHYAVPIVLYAPSDPTLRGYDQRKIVQQSDIMPTVLNYLHYDRPFVAFGQDMLLTSPDSTFAIHWLPENTCYQTVVGRYVGDFDGKEITAVYDYRSDPLLSRNLLGEIPPDTIRRMELLTKSFVQQYMRRMNGNDLVAEK